MSTVSCLIAKNAVPTITESMFDKSNFETGSIGKNNFLVLFCFKVQISPLTLSCLPIYPMPSLKVFYQNMDYYNELNIYQKVLNEFRPNFAETW